MEKIIFVKLCCIGDVLSVTPALRAVRKAKRDAHIAFLVSSWSKDVIETNPNVDEVIIFDLPYINLGKKEILRELISFTKEMRKRRFDIAFIFHRRITSSLLFLLSGVKERIGFDYLGRGLFLTKKVKYKEGLHEIEKNLHLIEEAGFSPDGTDPELFIPEIQREKAENIMRKYELRPFDFIVIHPAGGKNPGTLTLIKRWKLSYFNKLLQLINRKLGIKVVLVGGQMDREVSSKLELPRGGVDLTGKLSFLLLSALVEKARAFIGVDSGPLQISATLGVPSVGLYGPTDPRVFAPRGRNIRIIWKKFPCSPCYNERTVLLTNRFESCPHGRPLCMESIKPEEVFSEIDSLLSIRKT